MEIRLPLDRPVVLSLRLVQDYTDPFSSGERRVSDVGDGALTLLPRDFDPLADFIRHYDVTIAERNLARLE